MAIIECRSCGHLVEVDHIDKFPHACPACGRTTGSVSPPEKPSDDLIEIVERFLDKIPDVSPEEGDEIPEGRR